MLILLIILNGLYGSLFTLGKGILSYLPPLFFVGTRMIIGGTILLTFARMWYRCSFKIKKEHTVWFLALILTHVYLSYSAEYLGMNHVSSIKTVLLYNLSPFITALFSYLVFSEKMTLKKWVGLLIGFFGFIPYLVENSNPAEMSWYHCCSGLFSLGELLIMASVVFACMGWICVKKITGQWGYPYFFVNGIAMIFGGALSLGTSFLIETWPTQEVLMNPYLWAQLAAIIFVGNIAAYNLHGKLLSRYSATVISVFGSTIPLFTALFSWYFLKEPVSLGFFVTFILVSMGIYIFYQEELKREYIHRHK